MRGPTIAERSNLRQEQFGMAQFRGRQCCHAMPRTIVRGLERWPIKDLAGVVPTYIIISSIHSRSSPNKAAVIFHAAKVCAHAIYNFLIRYFFLTPYSDVRYAYNHKSMKMIIRSNANTTVSRFEPQG